tara:strand:+ start:73 stop:354 length:282 start_codon:yes stop_codon:yes gene_type:complete
MIKFINSNITNIINVNNLNKIINNLFKIDEPMFMLGRWCHVNIPKCNNDVIMRKIDFANSDNNLSYIKDKNNKVNISKNKPFTPQEYIDGINN